MSEETKALKEEFGLDKIKNGKLKEILKQKIDKVELKEVKDKLLGVLYMVCEFSNNGVLLARGVSVRSLLDGFNKKKGKNKAFGRAVKALLNETSTEDIRECIPDEELINRSITVKGDETYEELRRLDGVIPSYKQSGNKIFYQINSFLPLEIVRSTGIQFKSEFKPVRVGLKGADEF